MSQSFPLFTPSGGLAEFSADLRSWVFSSQAKAAEYFDLNHTTVSRYENGHVTPPIGYLTCLAQLMVKRFESQESTVEEAQQALLQAVNEALKWCYPDNPPFQDWRELSEVAGAYMGNRRGTGSVEEPMRPPRSYHQFIDRAYPDDYRYKEIQSLVRAIRARESRLLLGLPGMGTSNLLRFLVSRMDLVGREVTFAYLNCDALDDCLDLEALAETIAQQFQEQGLVGSLEKDERGYERLTRLVARIGGDPSSRIVIVVDQANALFTAVDKTFYRRLKALTDLNKRVCYLFGGNPPIAGMVDPDNMLFAGHKLIVGRLNELDCARAITGEARRLEVEFDPAAQEQVARLSGGHPGLLRAVASAVAEAPELIDTEETALVKRLLTREDVTYRCQKIWRALDPTQQTVLWHVASNQTDSVAAESIAWLKKFGLVDERTGGYQLFSPVFQQFVAAQDYSPPPLDSITIVGFSQNEHGVILTGKVCKGSREVHVTPLELRLIACLKREPKIYSKDEIAAYVYHEDTAKGEGISETAVENLVRQVRKRLGDPRYIKTHFGQGYEFLG